MNRTRYFTELIVDERLRQQYEEGWDESHDDQHVDEELAYAAAYYACPRLAGDTPYWPWDPEWDKSKKHSRESQLIIAGALILAELERLDRAKEAKE